MVVIKHELRKRYVELMDKARQLYDQGQHLSSEEAAEFRKLSLEWCSINIEDELCFVPEGYVRVPQGYAYVPPKN